MSRHFEYEFIWRLASDARIVDAMTEVMGDDVMLLGTHFFCKYPGGDTGKFVAWHQDVTYWGLEPAESAQLRGSPSTKRTARNGCMQAVAGSHVSGIAPHGKSDRDGNLLSINQEIPGEHIDKSKVQHLELEGRSDFHPSRQGLPLQQSEHLRSSSLWPDRSLHQARGGTRR